MDSCLAAGEASATIPGPPLRPITAGVRGAGRVFCSLGPSGGSPCPCVAGLCRKYNQCDLALVALPSPRRTMRRIEKPDRRRRGDVRTRMRSARKRRAGGRSRWVGGDVCMRRDRRYQSVRRYQPGALACSAPPLQAVWPCGVGVARPRVPLPRLPCLPSAARCHRHRCRCRRRRCAPRCWVRRHPRMLPQSPPLLTRKAFHPPRRGLLRTTQIKAGRSMI